MGNPLGPHVLLVVCVFWGWCWRRPSGWWAHTNNGRSQAAYTPASCPDGGGSVRIVRPNPPIKLTASGARIRAFLAVLGRRAATYGQPVRCLSSSWRSSSVGDTRTPIPRERFLLVARPIRARSACVSAVAYATPQRSGIMRLVNRRDSCAVAIRSAGSRTLVRAPCPPSTACRIADSGLARMLRPPPAWPMPRSAIA